MNHLYDSYSDIESFLLSASYLSDLLRKRYLHEASVLKKRLTNRDWTIIDGVYNRFN